MSTIAGSTGGFKDGVGTHAQFNYPYGITINEAGDLLVCDYFNHRIRKVTSQGVNY